MATEKGEKAVCDGNDSGKSKGGIVSFTHVFYDLWLIDLTKRLLLRLFHLMIIPGPEATVESSQAAISKALLQYIPGNYRERNYLVFRFCHLFGFVTL